MVTKGGELLIATRGARRQTTEDKKASKKGGAAFSLFILSYRGYYDVPVRTAPTSARRLHTVGWNPESVINRIQ
eukprot:scaffold307953_cov83-Attheya_sp.AAC.1